MRIVGKLNRSAFETNPQEAWRRARRLDAFLYAAMPPVEPRGVTRATHDAMARQDEARMLDLARRINHR